MRQMVTKNSDCALRQSSGKLENILKQEDYFCLKIQMTAVDNKIK